MHLPKEELIEFISESNWIEHMPRECLVFQLEAMQSLLEKEILTIDDLQEYVTAIQPDGHLRGYDGMNVRVGSYIPPAGGIDIPLRLVDILADAVKIRGGNLEERWYGAYKIYHRYESLHPFMDGNGRSGRALWLWTMRQEAPLGFLRTWHIQALKYARCS